MTTSYNEILSNMKNDYYQKCGKVLDMNSDMGARFEAVASELFSLSCYGDFVFKQAFVQSASGEYLDKHAQMRNIERKKATKSSGTLRFFCDDECTSTVKIPMGIICSVKDNAYIQFETIEEKTIDPSIANYVDVKAQSLNTGYDNNVPVDVVTNIVNPPASVTRVINTTAFVGGNYDETDTQLRNRILTSYSIRPTGFNEKNIEEAILTCKDVIRCKVDVKSSAQTMIYVETTTNTITRELEDEINEKLFLNKICEVVINIMHTTTKEYGLSIEVYKNDIINPNMDSQIKQTVSEIANSIGIAEDIMLSRFVSALSGIEGIKYCEAHSDSATQNIIYANRGEILKNNGLKVAYYESK